MSAAAVEQTMPAVAGEHDQVPGAVAPVIPIRAHETVTEPAQELTLGELTARLQAAENRIADLEVRNRELASDLDNALDQLSGHALHVEQERLVHAPAWSPWAASMNQGGHQR